MSLFPAYVPVADADVDFEGGATPIEKKKSRWVFEVERAAEPEMAPAASDSDAALEATLLATSDSDEAAAPPPAPLRAPLSEHFYLDNKPDGANLGVVTLYYPGRPIYKRDTKRSVGASSVAEGTRRRYYLAPAPEPRAAAGAAELEERARVLRALLAGSPRDEELWLRYVHFQEEWADAATWLEASEEAARAVPSGARVRAERHRARRAALAPRPLLDAIAADLRHEECPRMRLECWLRLMWALGGGAAEGAGAERELERAALAALADTPHEARAYPHLLYAYGSWLRAAGLWERLVLLLELVCAMNYPPAPTGVFPPTQTPADAEAIERRLQQAEDAVLDSGLPLSTVWVRVERLRAAAHWRAPPGGGGAGGVDEADPQRAPQAAEVAALVRGVRPGASLLMCVCMLRLAQVPLLPRSEATRRACTDLTAEGEGEGGAGAALVALGRAARRLPRWHAAHVAEAQAASLRRSLGTLLDPPHCMSDAASGYESWTRALWAAACGWEPALLCWRLRHVHALALLAEGAERRRLRGEARALLKAHGAGDATAFALFARIEAACGDAVAAERVALQAARAAAAAAAATAAGVDADRSRALFAARVLRELSAPDSAAPAWALCCAALGRALPAHEALHTIPPPALRADALAECSRRCTELERGFAGGAAETTADAAAAAALGAGGAGEWGAARVVLLSPAERHFELQRLRHTPYDAVHRTAASVQYYEQCACALVAEAAAEARFVLAARQLRALFPHNALLALACSGASLWTRREGGAGAGEGSPRSHAFAWAHVLPALLRAPVDNNAAPADMARLARASARAVGAGGGGGGADGAALATLRLEAEARAPRAGAGAAPHRVLLAALADYPEHKWVCVRGAAWVPAQAEALCDAALERGLRVHALMHELHPQRAAPPSPPPSAS